MKEDTEVAWEEVPEAGPENFREGEEELGEEPGEKAGKDTPGPGRRLVAKIATDNFPQIL